MWGCVSVSRYYNWLHMAIHGYKWLHTRWYKSFKPCATQWYKVFKPCITWWYTKLQTLCYLVIIIRSFKPCVTLWYKKFQTLLHSMIQKVSSLGNKNFRPCITQWYNKLCHSVIQKVLNLVSLGDTKVSNLVWLCDTKVSNLASLSDIKSIFKPCVTWWYKKFWTLCHSVIQKVLNLVSLGDTNLVWLCDTKSFKPCIT